MFERKYIFQTIIFGIYVRFRGVYPSKTLRARTLKKGLRVSKSKGIYGFQEVFSPHFQVKLRWIGEGTSARDEGEDSGLTNDFSKS